MLAVRLGLLTLASCVVLWSMIASCRWIARTSAILAGIVVAGIAVRLVVGLSFIVIPYLQTPALERPSLDGVGSFGTDARGYYVTARLAALEGLETIPADTPSITYVRLLALWFMMLGTSPFSPLLMNVTCYVLTSVIVVSTLRRLPDPLLHLSAGGTLIAFATSPMLIYVSTQPLKDPLFILLAVVVSAGAWALAGSIVSCAQLPWRRVLLALAGIALAIYLIAGVRIYYSLLVCCCLGVLFSTAVMLRHRMRTRLALTTAAATLVAGSLAFVLGSGGKAEALVVALANADGARTQLESARQSFVVAGGTTNMAVDEKAVLDEARSAAERVRRDADNAGPPDLRQAGPAGSDKRWTQHLRDAGVGLSAMFVPMTVLRALSVVDIGAGAAYLVFADIDTVFLDLTLALVIALLLSQRRTPTVIWSYVLFTLVLGVLLALMMSYVVTNFGTLVRLRLMLTVPFWTLPFAFRHFEAEDERAGSSVATLAGP